MRRLAFAILGRIRRIPRGTGISLLGHSLLVAGLFLLPGMAPSPAAGEQTTLVRVDPDAPARIVEPEPPPPPVDPPPAAAEPVPVEPRVVDAPPPEPEVFADAPVAAAVEPAAPSDFAPSVNRVIGIGPGPGTDEPAGKAPAPAPAARPAPAPPPTPVRVLAQPLPEYPRRAEELRLEGVVTLLVEVLPDGRVGRIDVKESTGHGILDRAAIAGVRKWEFRPATVRGQPVRSFVEVPVRFTP